MCVGIRCVMGCCLTEIETRDSQDLEYAKPCHLTLDHEISPGLPRLPEIKIKIKDTRYQNGLLSQKEEKEGDLDRSRSEEHDNYYFYTWHPLSPCRLQIHM